MSTNLYWRPLPLMPEPQGFPKELKYIISQRYWDHDGSLNSDPVTVGEKDRQYFMGLADAGIEGADDVLFAINKHGQIEIWLED